MAMTAKQEQYAKSLRQTIMIKVKREKGWSSEEFHQYLASWGYGDSLRKLSIRGLQEVLSIIDAGTEASVPSMQDYRAKYGIGQFDKQGDFVWSMLRELGWSNDRFRKFIGKRYGIVHWNALDSRQKSGVIVMLRKYLSTNYTNDTNDTKEERIATDGTDKHG